MYYEAYLQIDTEKVYSSKSFGFKDGQKGLVVPTTPISSGQKETHKKPNFKTLFENREMFNPDSHRNYFAVITDAPFDILRGHAGVNKAEYNSLAPFDRKKLELITLENNSNDYVTLSTKTIDYLKQQDAKFVKSIIKFNAYKQIATQQYNNVSYYNKAEYASKWYNPAMSYYNSKIADVNQKFNQFVGDFGESLLDLNKPSVFSYIDNDTDKNIPVNTSNYSPYDLQKTIDSIFGDVTGDDFIPVANEIKYDNKEPTNCCIKYCCYKDYYRPQKKTTENNITTYEDVPYSESKEKIADDTEFEKWLASDEFTPYAPPIPTETITVDSYIQLIKNVQRVLRSPINYAFELLSPYIEDFLNDIDGVKAKIRGNVLDIEIGFRDKIDIKEEVPKNDEATEFDNQFNFFKNFINN